jgi:hypothetical protein
VRSNKSRFARRNERRILQSEEVSQEVMAHQDLEPLSALPQIATMTQRQLNLRYDNGIPSSSAELLPPK